MKILMFWMAALVLLATIAFFIRKSRLAHFAGNLVGKWIFRLGDRLHKAGASICSHFYHSETKFSDLAPSDDSDPKLIYDKRLVYALHTHNIKNVAVTGLTVRERAVYCSLFKGGIQNSITSASLSRPLKERTSPKKKETRL